MSDEPRPGILKVFWPAFLGWGAAAIPMVLKLASRVSRIDLARVDPFPVFVTQVVGLSLSLLGILYVMRKHREANGCFALAVNFSVLVAWIFVALMWIPSH